MPLPPGPSTRRGLLASSEAVSPVIGVILMVAVTVVLAAVVFVTVTDITPKGGSSPPNIALHLSEADDKATVSGASESASWDQLEVRLSAAGQWGLNNDPDQAVGAGEWDRVDGGPLVAGDYLSFCLDTEGPADIDLRYIDLNSIVSNFHFTAVRACTP